MEKKPLKQLFSRSFGQVLLVVLILNIVNLLVELMRLEDFENISLRFVHGYFILNGKQIGLNIFSNLTALVIAVIVLMIFNSEKRSLNKSE